MEKWLEKTIGNVSFEEQKTPFAAVASDACSGEESASIG